jgi:integral membrane protein (TIGR01906 family)
MEDPSSATATWARIVGGVVTALIPIVLVLTSVRLLLTQAFVRVDYAVPGFPADTFGFSLQDRLHWAPIALDYLLNDAGIDYLGNLRFDSGRPVYNERELRHMADVKSLVQLALRVWEVGLVIVAISLTALWRGRQTRQSWRSIRAGALATLALMLLLGVGLAAAFSFVFVGFHRLFFSGDSWLFFYSDTLIRLFPEQFWQFAFAMIALGALLQAVILFLLARWRLRPGA